MNSIPVFKPLLDETDTQASREALELGWLGMGSYVNDFELGLQRFTEANDRHVVAVSTGHAALHLGLLIAGVGPGDEVITPSFNNITDFQAVLATGAIPVLCDIEDRSLCIDLDKAEALIGPKTKAIIATDYGCMLADHDGLRTLAEKHHLRVIHDAAHSLGSRYRGRMVGSFSDITMFSFDPIKTITCIDGGALIVRTTDELDALRELRLVGMGQPSTTLYKNQRAWTYDVKRLGFRYHMANMHGAIGLSQLKKIDRIVSSRRSTCRFYSKALGNLDGVALPQTNFDDIASFLYYIRVRSGRDGLREFLPSKGVDTGIHWQPGHWFTLLKDVPRGDLAVTERVGREILTIPLHSEMPSDWSERVAEAVTSYFKREIR